MVCLHCFEAVASTTEMKEYPHLFFIQNMMKENRNDIQQAINEIYGELLAVAADNNYLKASHPQTFRETVIDEMTSLTLMAKQDPQIRDIFYSIGKEPDDALDVLLQKAIDTL